MGHLPPYSQPLHTDQQTCWKTSSFRSRLVPLALVSSLSLVQDERHSGPCSRSSHSMSSVSESWRVLSESLRVTLQLREPTLMQDLESFKEQQNSHSAAPHPWAEPPPCQPPVHQHPGASQSHPPGANWQRQCYWVMVLATHILHGKSEVALVPHLRAQLDKIKIDCFIQTQKFPGFCLIYFKISCIFYKYKKL